MKWSKDLLDIKILNLYLDIHELYDTNYEEVFTRTNYVRNNTKRIINLNNKLNCLIQKRNKMYLMDDCHFDKEINRAKIYKIESQLKWTRQSTKRQFNMMKQVDMLKTDQTVWNIQRQKLLWDLHTKCIDSINRMKG
jgi:hypothetical protein